MASNFLRQSIRIYAVNTRHLYLPETEANLTFIADYLCDHKETMAIEENVTSGYLPAQFASLKEANRFFMGASTTHYPLVNRSLASPLTVSETITQTTALHVCQRFGCDWGIAINGYSSLLPQEGINTLFAFCCFAYREKIVSSTIIVIAPHKKENEIRQSYTAQVVSYFSRYLQTHSASRRAALLTYQKIQLRNSILKSKDELN